VVPKLWFTKPFGTCGMFHGVHWKKCVTVDFAVCILR